MGQAERMGHGLYVDPRPVAALECGRERVSVPWHPGTRTQPLTCMRAPRARVGLPIHFDVRRLAHGIRRHVRQPMAAPSCASCPSWLLLRRR